MRAQVVIVVLVVLLLRAPFLGVPAQWDDFNYLTAGEYALTNPAHPSWVKFYFHGQEVDMRGHPHPPGVAWILAALLALLGPFRELPFHSAFLFFSLTAALSMLVLARRFVPERALLATLLFLAVPASLVSGTSFESDLPLLAFWMLAAALFIEAAERRHRGLLTGAALAMAAASMIAYSAFFLSVLGALYLFIRRIRWPAAMAALLTPFATIAVYQLYERFTGGALPAGELLGHFQTHGYQRLAMKARNAIALLGHLGLMAAPLVWLPLAHNRWLLASFALPALAAIAFDPHPLFWLPIGCGALTISWTFGQVRHPVRRFLALWLLLYFGAAVVIFFAGAARYLLPLAAPLALLLALALAHRPRWLTAAVVFNLALGLAASWTNAEHWRESRRFALDAMSLATKSRVWTSAEWGARYYAERAGARALPREQVLAPGDYLLTSELSGNVPYKASGLRMVRRLEREIHPTLPLRIAGLDAGSAYATIGFGLRALGWSHGPTDRLALLEAVPIRPTLSILPMNAPDAEDHLLEGIYGLEQNEWRWAAPRAQLRLKSPSGPAPLTVRIFLPADAPGRTFTISADGRPALTATLPGEGAHSLTTAPLTPTSGEVTITLTIDRGFTPPGDRRTLGFILLEAGFSP